MVTENTHDRVLLQKDVKRLAVGSTTTVSTELVTSREILLLGKKPGQTTLMIWYADDSFEEQIVTVARDLHLLKDALASIDSRITVDGAPDRDAVVLRGTVHTEAGRRIALETARKYLLAGWKPSDVEKRQTTSERKAPSTGSGDKETTSVEALTSETARAPGALDPGPQVIDQLRVEVYSQLADETMMRAFAALKLGRDIRVRRIPRDPISADDSKDVFVLEGSVHDQVALVRAVTVAASILKGKDANPQIRVLADESGALATAVAGAGGGGGGQTSGIGATAGIGVGSSGGNLNNAVRKNVARAKILEAASGQILSFLTVRDLPQVRVATRLYEVNRTKLKSYSFNGSAPAANVPQPNGPVPAALANSLTLPTLGAFGPTKPMDVQNVFSFLNGGLSNQTQVVGKYFAVNLALNWLESEGIARNVSDPVLTVLSGEQAQFGAGDVIFVQGTTTVSTGAVLATTLTPIQTGVTLSVRPLVGEDDTITLDVEPQVATPDTPPVAGGPPPSINIRGLSTSARLDDGQALLIGGLVTRDHSDNASYVPFLGQIPVIDLLFKNTSHNEDELELVIVLVPTIVREPSQIGAMWAHEDLRDLMHSATAPSAPR